MPVALVIGVLGFVLLLCLEAWLRPRAGAGTYFQFLDSESSMHTVSLEDLRDAPIQTIMNIHIQPPMLDIVRAVIVRALTWWDPQLIANPRGLLLALDRSLFTLWAVVYGITGALIYAWLAEILPRKGAALTALVFLAHPASVLYASFPDGTLLSASLILVAYHALWRVSRDPASSVVRLAVCVLALFFTRSIFQLPAVLVFALSLVLFRVPRRSIAVFLLITLTVTGLYVGKQYFKFRTFSTSTFTGVNLTRSLAADPNHYMIRYWRCLLVGDVPGSGDDSLPRVLTRKLKFSGTPNFNHLAHLECNRGLMREYRIMFDGMSASDLALQYAVNVGLYFEPSSTFTEDILVEALPWRSLFDRVFSKPVLVVLVLLAGTAAAARAGRRDWRPLVGLALPALFVAAVSIVCERPENMRYKYFLEPSLIVFLSAQLLPIMAQVSAWTLRRLTQTRN